MHKLSLKMLRFDQTERGTQSAPLLPICGEIGNVQHGEHFIVQK